MIYKSKISLVFALLAAAGLFGCIKDRAECPGKAVTSPVVFAPQVATRAAAGHPIGNDAAIPVGEYYFGVYAWVQPTAAGAVTDFGDLQNTRVKHDSATEYTYSPAALWPPGSDAKLSFLAYYPWSDNSGDIKVMTGTGAGQWMKVAYTVPADSGEHVDLMYSKTAMMSGYDPVQLNFNHALARLRFEGRTEGFAAGSTIKITGIKVKGATLKGELTVFDPAIQPGKPLWELDDTVKGEMTIPASHINDMALDGTLQTVIPTGGDMLVLPQNVEGLSVEVSVSQNGTTLPMPFTFSLASTPDWTMNEINTYEITVRPDGAFVTARVADWTADTGKTILDGTHWLELSHNSLGFGCDGGSPEITLETNYDGPTYGGASSAHPSGIFIDYPAEFPAWLTVSDVSGADGSMLRTIKVTADPNTDPGAPDRDTYFTVRTGNLNYRVNVTQSKDPWLTMDGGMYYLDGGLYTAEVTSDRDWSVAIDESTNLVTGYRLIEKLVATEGTAGPQYPLPFFTFDDANGDKLDIQSAIVYLVFTDTTGVNAPKSLPVILHAVNI